MARIGIHSRFDSPGYRLPSDWGERFREATGLKIDDTGRQAVESLVGEFLRAKARAKHEAEYGATKEKLLLLRNRLNELDDLLSTLKPKNPTGKAVLELLETGLFRRPCGRRQFRPPHRTPIAHRLFVREIQRRRAATDRALAVLEQRPRTDGIDRWLDHAIITLAQFFMQMGGVLLTPRKGGLGLSPQFIKYLQLVKEQLDPGSVWETFRDRARDLVRPREKRQSRTDY